MPGWFDSHCHIQEEYLPGSEADVQPVLSRAEEAGIDRLVCIGTGPDTSRQAVAVARATALEGSAPRAWASIGLHPHEARDGVDEVAALLEREVAVHDGAVVAVGECGLDYFYEHSARDAQRAAFAAQIALAHTHGLALVIHARDAWPDLFDVLEAEGVPERTVLHCFTGGPAEVERCLRAGHVRVVQRHRDVQERRRRPRGRGALPLDRLLVETDSPFLAPVPHRGRHQRAVVPAARRRGDRRREGLQRRRGERAQRGRGRHGVFHRQLNHALLCVIREPCDQGV